MVAEGQRLLLARKFSPLNPMQTPKMAFHLKLLSVITTVGFRGRSRVCDCALAQCLQAGFLLAASCPPGQVIDCSTSLSSSPWRVFRDLPLLASDVSSGFQLLIGGLCG